MIVARDNCFRSPVSKGRDRQAEASYLAGTRVKEPLLLDLGGYLAAGNKLCSFFDPGKREARSDPRALVVALTPDADDGLLIQTGNFVGRFTHGGVDFDIRSRFSDAFLHRMLNFANDIYIDDARMPASTILQALDHARLMLYFLFVQALEKAYLLGLPKGYKTVQHHDMAVRGRIDVARFVRYDIPFAGKVASNAREQSEVQAVVDVLAQALRAIENRGGKDIVQRVSHVRAHLKERKSGKPVTAATVRSARADKALQNPIFAPYRRVLELAEMVLASECPDEDAGGKAKTPGFLINVAELFEIYVRKLVSRAFADWRVESPHIELHASRFYARKIIPDIVMEHTDGRVAVFDTKYKRMNYQGRNQFGMGDVDREDFFQINTYMSYYQQHAQRQLVAGGLVYPLSAPPQAQLCHDAWMMSPEVRFVIDGIHVPDGDADGFDQIAACEQQFIARVGAMLDAAPAPTH